MQIFGVPYGMAEKISPEGSNAVALFLGFKNAFMLFLMLSS